MLSSRRTFLSSSVWKPYYNGALTKQGEMAEYEMLRRCRIIECSRTHSTSESTLLSRERNSKMQWTIKSDISHDWKILGSSKKAEQKPKENKIGRGNIYNSDFSFCRHLGELRSSCFCSVFFFKFKICELCKCCICTSSLNLFLYLVCCDFCPKYIQSGIIHAFKMPALFFWSQCHSRIRV